MSWGNIIGRINSLSNETVLIKVKEQQQQHENAEYIGVPSFCDLTEGQTYSLHCSEAYKVQPKVRMSK